MHSADAVSLRDYVDLRFRELQRLLDKSDQVLDARLKSMNEIREHLREQATRFVTRMEMDDKVGTICEDVRELQKGADEARGKASQMSVIFTAAMSLAGLILGLIHIFTYK